MERKMILKYDLASDEEKRKLPYLDNLLNIVDEKECERVERKFSAYRVAPLISSKKFQKMPLDENMLCYIHKTLFQDIYPWAGTFRTCNISKDESTFFNVEFLTYGLNEFFTNLQKDDFLKHLTRTEFVELLTYYSNELNFLHPFREGNGRTKKIFLTELAKRAGYKIDYSKITHEEFRNAEISAFGIRLDNGKIMSSIYPLKKLYNENIEMMDSVEYKPQTKTIEELINRILWIYDRESQVNWMSCHESMQSGVNDVKTLLQTKEGKEKLIKYLNKAREGIKPVKIVKLIDDIITKLNQTKQIENKNLEY